MLLSLEAPGKGGVGNSCRRIAHLLSTQYNVHILTVSDTQDTPFSSSAKQLISETDGPVNIHTMTPYSGTLTSCPPQELQHLLHFATELHNQFNFEIFHSLRIVDTGFLAVLLAQKLSKKAIVSIRGNDIGRDTFDASLHARMQFVLSKADSVTSVNQELLSLAHQVFDIQCPSKVIWNSIYPSFFIYHPEHHQKAVSLHKKFTIGFIGKMRGKKGGSYLLEAFHKFRQKINCQLLFVGGFIKDEESAYQELISKANIPDIIIIPPVPHNLILNYIKECDLTIFPAVSDGCPNALLESFYAHTPVIATSAGVVSELPDDILFKISPHSSDSIFNALLDCYQHPEKAKQKAEAAHKFVSETYTWHHEQAHWLSLYETVLSGIPQSISRNKIFVRINPNEVQKIYPTKESYLHERAALRHYALQRVTPKLISESSQSITLVLEKFSNPAKESDFHNSDKINILAKTIASFHRWDSEQVPFKDEECIKLSSLLNNPDLASLISQYAPSSAWTGLTNNDLHPEHIFFEPSPKIIDWEKWGRNYVCKDIGYLVASVHIQCGQSAAVSLLSSYHNNNPLSTTEYIYGIIFGIMRHLAFVLRKGSSESISSEVSELIQTAHSIPELIKSTIKQ